MHDDRPTAQEITRLRQEIVELKTLIREEKANKTG